METDQTKKTKPLPPDPDEMNDQRAGWVNEALEVFAGCTNQSMEDELSDIFGDFLADMMHFCDRHDLDFEERLRNARMHYGYETSPGESGE